MSSVRVQFRAIKLLSSLFAVLRTRISRSQTVQAWHGLAPSDHVPAGHCVHCASPLRPSGPQHRFPLGSNPASHHNRHPTRGGRPPAESLGQNSTSPSSVDELLHRAGQRLAFRTRKPLHPSGLRGCASSLSDVLLPGAGDPAGRPNERSTKAAQPMRQNPAAADTSPLVTGFKVLLRFAGTAASPSTHGSPSTSTFMNIRAASLLLLLPGLSLPLDKVVKSSTG